MSRFGAEGEHWAIATPHTAATEAGSVAFEQGGNAIDAALWAAVTLAVTYPHMCGVGGDLFAVVQRRGHDGGDTLAVNSSGRAPRAIDPEALRARYGGTMPLRGPEPITVPGAVAGWATLHRMGARLPWEAAFERAVAFAEGGVPVARDLAETLAEPDLAPLFRTDPGMAGIFYRHGRPPSEGDRVANPALGGTLRALAAGGAKALYGGPVGTAYVRGLRAAGSPIDVDDLVRHEALILPPLTGSFGDLHVRVAPPNSQGFALLQILAAIERLGIDPNPDGPDAGMLARIFLVALRDVHRHLADPDRMRTHVSTLLDDGHLAAFCDEVRDGDGNGPAPSRPSGDTIALVAADADGHGVSLIQSLYHGFGSGILEPETGIIAHDRGACFTLTPGQPNTCGPDTLPLHTLLPASVHRDGRLAGVVGTMGGYQQPQIDAQTIIRTFVRGIDPERAVRAARFVVDDLPTTETADAVVFAEADVPTVATDAIRGSGLPIQHLGHLDGSVGHAHVIRLGPDGLQVGSDPRADGAAAAG
jgi:gamma-glutamyltranspeptidase